jgi:5-methylcytosine-specific restriction enzyme A
MTLPNWTLDELILALQIYMKHRPRIPDDTHPDVVELSDLLRSTSSHHSRVARFRNSNGVSMKLGNFRRLDSEVNSGGLDAGNRLEELVWNAFAHDRDALDRVAANIRNRYRND